MPDPEQIRHLEHGLAARIWGSGRKILLVPGWEGRYSQFAVLIPALVASGFQAVCIDPPAHGLSAKADANPFLFGQAVGVAARALGPFHGAIGHSLGGMAIMVALERGLQVNRAILISTPASIPGLLDRVCRGIGFGRKATEAFARRVDRIVGVSAEYLEASRLCAWRTEPVLIVHDENDQQVPFSESRDIASAWPGSRAMVTTGLGHNRILAERSVCEKMAEFLISYGR